jgi:SAM-dependent methyltransferase
LNKAISKFLRFTRLGRPVRSFSSHFSRAGMTRWLESVADSLVKETPAPQILNIGAGGEIGAFVARIESGKVTSVDIDPRRKPDVVADACRLPFADAAFDAVFMLEVLEHIPRARDAVREAIRVLKPRGRLVISTPFFFELHDEPHDYWRFTHHGLRDLLTGMHDLQIKARNGYIDALLVPLFRLWRSPYFFDGCLGLYFLAMALPGYPFIWLMRKLVRSEAATTGYFVECRR